MKYFWKFGDGNTSTVVNPIHTYDTLGTIYNVCLYTHDTITNCKDTFCSNVYVTSGCDSNFYAVFQDSILCSIFNKSNAASVQWDFGDGNMSFAKNGKHVYSALGSYKLCKGILCT